MSTQKTAHSDQPFDERDATNLLSVIADIREKSGVGAKPMLSELADAIAQRIAMPEGILGEIAAERLLQIGLGYDAAHDDQHADKEIIAHPDWGVMQRLHSARYTCSPATYRKALISVAAMAVAEIERADRESTSA